MPKETFWDSATAVENDGVSEPVATVPWGDDHTGVYLNGVHFDDSGIERLQTTLRRATGKERTVKVTLTAQTDDYVAGMERATEATRSLLALIRSAGIAQEDIAGFLNTVRQFSKG